MSLTFTPATGALAALDLLRIEIAGAVAHMRLNRPAKRNAVNDTLIAQLHTAFVYLPEAVKARGADAARATTSAPGSTCRSCPSAASPKACCIRAPGMRRWTQIQFGRVPVVAVLHGAVVGGGLELASAAHIRVAEESAYYGLPEGQRGIFVGGGGSARVPRLIGVARMTDMMLTGRVLDAARRRAPRPVAIRRGRRRRLRQGAASWPARSPATRRCRTSR